MAHAANDLASPKAPAPPREVLAELVRDASAGANEQLGAMVNRLAAAMADMTTTGLEPQAAYRRARAGQLLKNNSYAFVHLAGEAVERALREAIDELVPGARSRAEAISLSLVPMEVMDTQVAFGTLCRPFEIAHSELLASLCVRIGLLLGRDPLRPGQNPFRPEVFLTAIHAAWRAFTPEQDDHPLLLPLLRASVFTSARRLRRAGHAVRAWTRRSPSNCAACSRATRRTAPRWCRTCRICRKEMDGGRVRRPASALRRCMPLAPVRRQLERRSR
jgi:hypothetical protein